MFSDPEQSIEQFGLQPGMRVADLGAGSGFYTFAAARLVGGAGRVYAVDVQRDLLERLKHAAREARLGNIEVLSGDAETLGGTKLRDGAVDRVIVSNILFQLADKKTFAAEAARILRPGGKLLLVEWSDSFGNMGPTPDMVVPREAAQELFEGAGLSLEREVRAGDHHYGFVFKKGP